MQLGHLRGSTGLKYDMCIVCAWVILITSREPKVQILFLVVFSFARNERKRNKFSTKSHRFFEEYLEWHFSRKVST